MSSPASSSQATVAASSSDDASGFVAVDSLAPLLSPHFLHTGRILILSLANGPGVAQERMTVQSAILLRDGLRDQCDSGARKNMHAVRNLHTPAELREASFKRTLTSFASGNQDDFKADTVMHRRLESVQQTIGDSSSDNPSDLYDAERADWLLRHVNHPLNYRGVIDQLVQTIEVDPNTIKEKLRAAMIDVRSAMIVAMGHGDDSIQEQYQWRALLKPYTDRLDGAIFMCCQGDKSIKKQVKKLPLKYLTVRRNIAIHHTAIGRDTVTYFLQFYLSFVTGGWYGGKYFQMLPGFLTIGAWLQRVDKSQKSFIINRWRNNMLKAPIEKRAAFYTYAPPTSPMEHADLMTVLMEFANEATKPFRDRTLRENNIQNIEDLADLHWSNDI